MSRYIASDVRRHVYERAKNRCEYCLKPTGVSLYKHQIDHIIPIKHDGDSSENNLALAYFRCNVSKGSNISGFDESGQLTPLFNPRDDHLD